MPTKKHPRTTVYGATGYTGGLICEELGKRELDFVAAGRSLERLQGLSSRIGDAYGVVPTLRSASVDNPDSLDDLLEGTDVLINCAGPFEDLGPPVARAALRNDVHYLDTTGEQRHIRWIRDRLADEAKQRNVVMMPACAYEYATGALVSQFALDQSARRIGVCYGGGFSTSAGTKKSIVRSIAENGVAFRDGRLVEDRTGATIYRVPCPDGERRWGAWFAGGEPLLVPELGEVEVADSCVTVDKRFAEILPWLSKPMTGLARVARPVVDSLVEWFDNREAQSRERRSNTPGFQVVAFDPEGDRWFAAVSGDDAYDMTARIIVEAAERIGDASDDTLSFGLQSPPALFDATGFAESVGLRVDRNDRG